MIASALIPTRAVAIVTGLGDRGPRTGVALREPSSRLGRPCNLRSGLARYRRRYPCIATRQTDGAANGTPQVEPVGTSLSRGKPDEANHQRKDKEHRGGANPNGEPGIARRWLINVGHFAKPGKRARQICREMQTAPAGSHSWRRSTPTQAAAHIPKLFSDFGSRRGGLTASENLSGEMAAGWSRDATPAARRSTRAPRRRERSRRSPIR